MYNMAENKGMLLVELFLVVFWELVTYNRNQVVRSGKQDIQGQKLGFRNQVYIIMRKSTSELQFFCPQLVLST